MTTPLPLVYPDVCGWNASTNTLDQIIPSASSSVMPPPQTSSPHPSPITVLEPVPVRPACSRQPSRTPRRSDDPNHVPRPRNAFFIFRCEFTRKHTGEAKDSTRSSTPEKVLSKRAGAAWAAMSDAEKGPYRDEAKKESKRHTLENPGYRYKPKRKKPPQRRTTGPVTRREQVESLVQLREGTSARLAESTSGCPHSHASSSPEPDGPVTPRDLQHRRSMSLPHIDGVDHLSPYSYTHTYFITPASCSSSPSPDPQRNGRRLSSARQRSFSPNMYIPPPDLSFDLEFAEATAPFALFSPRGSTVSLPELSSLQDFTFYDDGSSTYSTPQISPAASMYDISQPECFAAPLVPQQHELSAPAFNRRHRSNTAPSATMSPLAFLSSSLSNWNGEAPPPVTLTRGSTAPALTISPPDPSASLLLGQPPIQVITDEADYGYGTLLAPGIDLDPDRTPRRADFAPNVQALYAPPYVPTPPLPPGYPQPVCTDVPLAHASPGEAYALESYSEGLGAFDITPAIYDMSPFEDIDFSDFLHVSQ
ncbi:uncharacterized protein PHACADRAFT_184752 [Phanerochaete carnosa HHB-10118-sp]|uniref:HMG box domain-containing protein n=1 Tax=Phanerochaete carnosa (strain HHB-10118-sp) TaxID=650164 RepID=K5WZU3_PHACS|nr:uncharacterized protein PHACADRAFT_184752 [Phanerochaete carnosa HHB-10118-sp]EKM56042.1 hypothetical protein PHACADRAFT_184752 [Phanerochaete carnosa HHB-10118-sp]